MTRFLLVLAFLAMATSARAQWTLWMHQEATYYEYVGHWEQTLLVNGPQEIGLGESAGWDFVWVPTLSFRNKVHMGLGYSRYWMDYHGGYSAFVRLQYTPFSTIINPLFSVSTGRIGLRTDYYGERIRYGNGFVDTSAGLSIRPIRWFAFYATYGFTYSAAAWYETLNFGTKWQFF